MMKDIKTLALSILTSSMLLTSCATTNATETLTTSEQLQKAQIQLTKNLDSFAPQPAGVLIIDTETGSHVIQLPQEVSSTTAQFRQFRGPNLSDHHSPKPRLMRYSNLNQESQ